jgi:hypothetical protein
MQYHIEDNKNVLLSVLLKKIIGSCVPCLRPLLIQGYFWVDILSVRVLNSYVQHLHPLSEVKNR